MKTKFETRQLLAREYQPKKMSDSLHMSSSEVSLVAAVLGLRSKARTAQPSLQEKIRNLKGILDLNSVLVPDWRKGYATGANATGANATGPGNVQGGAYHNKFRRQQQGPDPRYRGPPPNNVPYHRNTNQQVDPTAGPPPQRLPPIRYQSRFKNSAADIEEKILNRIIRLKLNKFGQSTYNEIREFLFQILGDDKNEKVGEFVRDFMMMVFSKAAAEEIYCPLYAQLLSEIGKKYTIIFVEMEILLRNYMEIFEDIDSTKVSNTKESYEKETLEKKYRHGYSQFLAELTALEILPAESLTMIFKTLFELIDKYGRIDEKRALIEEYVDCMLRMSRVLKSPSSQFFATIRKKIFSENRKLLDTLIHLRDTTYPSLSSKSRFLLMDIHDILVI
jgi:hypothetical protein